MSLAGGRLGTHRGTAFYTPGQRRGLGVTSSKRLYVVHIDASSNTVVLGGKEDLFETSCILEDVNLMSVDRLQGPLRTEVKIRYATPAVTATAVPIEDGRVELQFDAPQDTLSPGQSAVLYEGDRVLGGGIIAGKPSGCGLLD